MNTHISTLLLLCGSVASLFSCNSDNASRATGEKQELVIKEYKKPSGEGNYENTTEAAPKHVRFVLKDLGESDFGAPQTQLSLDVDGTKTILDTVLACNLIPATTFSQYNIPKTALSACGGWWAGGGDYFYVVLQDNRPVVYQGWQDEQQEDTGYHWEKRK
jgi:hypothetical protein